MKIMLLGSTGQLGKSFLYNSPEEFNLYHFSHSELDISNINRDIYNSDW